jgi:NAD(P)-dependent dehydrogenase (short-subunit alcohol dehydrogenase family)
MTAPGTTVVTGAAKGIGGAVSERLVADGYTVVAVDVDGDALAGLCEHLGTAVIPITGDVSVWETHERAAEEAVAAGTLTGWVNNAGVDWPAAAHEATAEQIEEGVRLLQLSAMYGGAVAVRAMLPARRGSIVNVSSIQAVVSFPGYYVYAAAKAAIVMATKSIAVDYGPYGIRANVVLPGCIETPMTLATLPPGVDQAEALRMEGELAPLNRVGQASEVADVVSFALSDRGAYVTGAELVVDGGATARCRRYPPPALD